MSPTDKQAIRLLVALVKYDLERPRHGQFPFYMLATRLEPAVLEIGIRYVQIFGKYL